MPTTSTVVGKDTALDAPELSRGRGSPVRTLRPCCATAVGTGTRLSLHHWQAARRQARLQRIDNGLSSMVTPTKLIAIAASRPHSKRRRPRRQPAQHSIAAIQIGDM